MSEVQSVRRALELLSLFTRQQPQRGLSELAEEAHLPVSTVARLTKTLEALGFLERVPGTPRYQLSMQLYYLGKVVEERMDVRRLAQPVLDRLSQNINESTDLYIRQGDYRVCIAQAHSTHAVRHVIPLGERLPLWAGSAGAVLLAYTDRAEVARLLAAAQSLTPKTILDPEAWEQRLDKVRRDGYAASFEERELGAASVAAPVFSGEGRVVAVIDISGPVQRFDDKSVAAYTAAVLAAAAEVSALLGYRAEKEASH